MPQCAPHGTSFFFSTLLIHYLLLDYMYGYDKPPPHHTNWMMTRTLDDELQGFRERKGMSITWKRRKSTWRVFAISVFAGKKGTENKREAISWTNSSSNMFSMLSSQGAEAGDKGKS